jgi:hypothetical protein
MEADQAKSQAECKKSGDGQDGEAEKSFRAAGRGLDWLHA